MEPAERDIMKRQPRKQSEHILDGEWGRLIFSSFLGFSVSFLFYLWRLSEGMSLGLARTETLTLAIMFELFLAFSTRSNQPIWKVGFFSNRWMIGGILIPFAA
ncbi:MAG: cation transporting ATPase C-terminal domain-containing protein [bacterium]|nr:cation transporting ATPase C-terminal domain-containing protein [bacterium]MDA1292817.1 cation transporting ATPase C-terminal domain-containing protein [bacterium]